MYMYSLNCYKMISCLFYEVPTASSDNNQLAVGISVATVTVGVVAICIVIVALVAVVVVIKKRKLPILNEVVTKNIALPDR